jgi:hypothetical protein
LQSSGNVHAPPTSAGAAHVPFAQWRPDLHSAGGAHDPPTSFFVTATHVPEPVPDAGSAQVVPSAHRSFDVHAWPTAIVGVHTPHAATVVTVTVVPLWVALVVTPPPLHQLLAHWTSTPHAAPFASVPAGNLQASPGSAPLHDDASPFTADAHVWSALARLDDAPGALTDSAHDATARSRDPRNAPAVGSQFA